MPLKSVARGIYRDTKTGSLYRRPWVAGKRTWRKIQTETKPETQQPEVCHDRENSPTGTPTVGEIIRKYIEDGYPDAHKQKRPAIAHHIEERNCQFLLKFFADIPTDRLTLATCDRYHTWRTQQVKRGSGNRTVDLDLNTLSNAVSWARRCELITADPISHRPRYHTEAKTTHCRERMPEDATQLHAIAGHFMALTKRSSQAIGWAILIIAQTGLRSSEAMALRWNAREGPGSITTDGKSLCVRRAKNSASVNPYCEIHSGLKATLDAYKAWRVANKIASNKWFPIGPTAIAHALKKASKKLVGHQVTPHGLRAFFVTVRRSHGISDPQISFEIGHKGSLLATVYGGAPPHWRTDGPKMDWLPTPPHKPAWE